MLRKSRLYKSDGDNTTKRFSLSRQKKFNSARVVLNGFPVHKKFKTILEINHYLSGDRIQCLLCGKQKRARDFEGQYCLRCEKIEMDAIMDLQNQA